LILLLAHTATQTTHGDNDLPTSIFITYPLHPHKGKTLKVLGRCRRHKQLMWLVQLPDGSHCYLPDKWVKSRDEPVKSQCDVPNTKTPPHVLKELIRLLKTLVGDSNACKVCSGGSDKGGENEQTNETLRRGKQRMGFEGVEFDPGTSTTGNYRHACPNGQSSTAGQKKRKAEGGER